MFYQTEVMQLSVPIVITTLISKPYANKKKHHVISVGYRGESIKLLEIHPNAEGQYTHFQIAEKHYQVQLNLHGAFQVFNLMTSLGILMAFGHPIEDVINFIPRLTEIEGRFNTIGFTPSGGQIIVDFAHTINGLKQALMALGKICKGKTYVLMGAPSCPNLQTCQQMAILASKMANHLIITDSHAPKPN